MAIVMGTYLSHTHVIGNVTSEGSSSGGHVDRKQVAKSL